MAKLLSSWPYSKVNPLEGMAFNKGDRVVYCNAPGTIDGYDFFSPQMWYVQLDENEGLGATRVHVSSITLKSD